MTMILNTPPPAMTSAIWKGGIRLLVRFRRLVNNWVAAALARRERQAALVVLRKLGDRELKDIGLHRCQIDDAIAAAAKARLRQLHRS
jgi:uncharacterized protein YjiS (DUF1127 family)